MNPVSATESEHLIALGQLLVQVNRLIGRSLNDRSFLQGVCDLFIQSFDDLALACVVPDPSDDPQHRVLFSQQNPAPGALNCLGELDTLATITGIAPPLQRVDVQALPTHWRPALSRCGIRTGLALPLLRQQNPWGTLWLFHTQEPPNHPAITHLFINLAEDIAHGLERIDLSLRRAQLQQELIRARDYQSALFAHNAAGILIVDRHRMIIDANPALCRMMGYTSAELIGHSAARIHFNEHSFDAFRVQFSQALAHGSIESEYQFRRRDGNALWARILGAGIALADGSPGVLWSIIDTSDLHTAQQKLGYQALHDPLTDLPNRRSFERALELAMAEAAHRERLLAVVLLDLDNFKPINDQFGHEAGDLVLTTTAERLRNSLRQSDFVARLGGDEFVLLLGGCQQFAEIEPLLRKLDTVIRAPITLAHGQLVSVELSAGIALYPRHESSNADALLRFADQAMYQSKQYKLRRARCWALYDEPLPLKENPAQRQLNAGALTLWYQPIFANASQRVVGIEALVRLQAPDGSLWLPDQFIPALDTADLLQLTRQVLARALADLHHLDALGHSLWVSVNLHPHSVTPEGIALLKAGIDAGGIAPERITLEILESSHFDEQQQTVRLFQALRALGIRLALDDIGTAYSSLQRMRDLPIDKVKLDQSFVRGITQRPQDMHFIRSIHKLAFNLGIELIVEGVETEIIRDAVRIMGVPMIQGFGLAAPMPLPALCEWLDHTVAEPPAHRQPTSLLGLYAAQFNHHEMVAKMLRSNAHLLNPQTAGDACCCPIHQALLSLKLPPDDPLFALHNDIHAGFARCLSQQEHWQAAEDRQLMFEQAILARF
ncbi:putative bifunctional diguanylate cyclase/phosphodiesterase [Halothiobacillus sp. DCM-1]|uniref:putative bifunctional diguanylate cyclase/phosphodiesterase n=1 Tax=Halothiobacillus sp. DCM-1 TaxID=3112558 RepID=UPI00324BE3C4